MTSRLLLLSLLVGATLASDAPCETCPTTLPPRPVELCPDCVNQFCTPNMCNYGALLPYPGDCSRFCQCHPSGAIAMDCPDGTVFHPTLEVCVWPSESSCVNGAPYPGCNGVPTTPTPFPTTTPACTTTTHRPVVLCPECVTDQCTPNMCNLAENLPYPGDCTKFCKCDHGGAIEFDCPDGLVFDPILDVCVWPDDSSCSNDDPFPGCGGDPTETTTEEPTTTTTTRAPTTTTTTTTRPPTTTTTTTTRPPTTTTTTTTKPPTTTTTKPPTTTTRRTTLPPVTLNPAKK